MAPIAIMVGAPGAGKTTVGQALADLLGVPFADTDALVEAAAGKPIPEIFFDDGEPVFRELEVAAIGGALGSFDGVLALGGGAVTSVSTRALLVAHGTAGGTVVWLDVDLPSAAKRVGLSRDRPILGVNPRAMLRQMLEVRAPLYAEVATATVPTGGREPDDVVADVAAILQAPRAGR